MAKEQLQWQDNRGAGRTVFVETCCFGDDKFIESTTKLTVFMALCEMT